MAIKKEAPQEEGAPAYFAQYAALWCILLSFFVMVLSMGKQKNAEFQRGIGQIRNAFGVQGGLGLSPFVHTIKAGWLGVDSVHTPPASSAQKQDVAGYLKGLLWREGFPKGNILNVDVTDAGTDVIVQTPILFEAGTRRMTGEAQQAIEAVGAVLMDLYEWETIICCVSRDGDDLPASKRLAFERAIALDRYMQKTYSIPGSRISALGCSDYSHIKGMADSELDQAVLLLLHKKRLR